MLALDVEEAAAGLSARKLALLFHFLALQVGAAELPLSLCPPFPVPSAPMLRGSSRLWRAFRVAPHVACIHVHPSIHPSTHSAYMCALYVFPARAHAVFARLSQGRRHVTHGMCSLAARQVCWRHQRMLVWVTLKLPSLLPPRSSPEYKVRMHAPDARLPPSPCTRPRSSPLRV